MSLPTRVIGLTQRDRAAVLAGLELLVIGIANAKIGLLPRRHPWDRIDLQASNVYTGRAFSEEMSSLVLNARKALRDPGMSNKVRLNVFELSAAALALRIVTPKQLIPSVAVDPHCLDGLKGRLEKFRKRARNAATRQVGHDTYKEYRDQWQAFVKWLRYYCCYTTVPRRKTLGALRLCFTSRAKAIRELMTKSITDRGFAPIAEEKILQLARLVTAELNRGRHPGVSVRSLL